MSNLRRWKMSVLVFAACVATAIASSAQTFTSLASFNGGNGANPFALVQGRDGNLYGVTAVEGAQVNGNGGTIYKLGSGGTIDTLYSFCALSNCTDGQAPNGLTLGTDGNFYGTTFLGGPKGEGTFFKITPGGTLTTLYTFCSLTNCADGVEPEAQLVQGLDGNFYGITYQGGAHGPKGGGTVFKITPAGKLTTIHSFCNLKDCSDGKLTFAGLAIGADGSFYGTTLSGGLPDCSNGCGTIFRITPAGAFKTLYKFCSQANCADGDDPTGGLVQGSDGDFYGTTLAGGNPACPLGCGTVFKITPSGTLTTLHSFDSIDGKEPYIEKLTQGSDGNFYGTTMSGGNNNPSCNGGCGTAFQISSTGTFNTLYDFCNLSNCTDGSAPYTGMIQRTNGTFYGTTAAGGSSNDGTVFTISTGAHPLVAFMRNFGKVGQTVRILGQGFTGASAVTLNGISASFSVKSNTFLTATVPSGATTGPVTVTVIGTKLTGNVPFQVTP